MGNLFASHGNNGSGTINYSASRIFQIDGNFGLASGISEMLIQSQLGYVQFLPAIPARWTDGEVNGMIARGNFEIDMKWSDGNADYFRVTSNVGGTFTGEYANLANATVTTSTGRKVAFEALSEDQITFNTTKGTTYIIKLSEAAPKNAVTLNLTGAEEATLDVEELSYTLSASGADQLATATVTLQVEGLGEPVVETVNGWYVIAQSYENGLLSLVVCNNEGVSGEAEILKVVAPTTGEIGAATVSIVEASLSAYVGSTEAFVDTVLGAESVTTEIKYSVYDVNEDGIVNQLDITRAQRLFGQETEAKADVNDDGKVDITDLILILNNYTA